MSALSRQLQRDGVLVLTLDVPGEKLNVLGKGVLLELQAILDEVPSSAEVKAVVLCSGKPDNFIAGADIKDFLAIKTAEDGEALSRAGHAILSRLESLRQPVVVAIHGACLGGGLETALACRYRVASDSPKTKIGLPEVNLGLLPGAGGSQRLPRLVGLAASLDMILTGRSLSGPRAKKIGLVDEVAPPEVLLDVAKRAAVGLASGTLHPTRRGITLLERLARPILFRKARAATLAKTGGHYPAPLRAIDAIEHGTATTLENGLKLEARLFGELSVSDASRALVSVFFATQDIKKDIGVPAETAPIAVNKLGVLGAGLMGAGIAGVAVDQAGVAVRLRDKAGDAVGKGLRYVRDSLEERRKRGSLSRLDLERRMQRLSPTTDYSGFRRCELVIEAVFEDLDVKRKVLAEVEAATGDECIFATNTSAIPIAQIARDARRPGRVLGMHFFSPVHKMPLLEVVVTAKTEAVATATAVAFGRQIGKNVIVVRDGAGFYTTRALGAYMNEAARVVEEGARIEDVDAAMTGFGFPVGPLVLLDEVGIDVGAKVSKQMHEAFGERMSPPASMARLLQDGRLGRKNKRGFYTYNGKKQVDQSIYAVLPSGVERRSPPAREIQERLVFSFLNESALCLQEGILRSPRDGDVGAIFGLGFPPFLGGPFRHMDRLGARAVVETLERLLGRHGPRFEPAPGLRDLLREGKTFHS